MGIRQTAFTLVELLIVAVVLGVFAAVVVGQFGDATADAERSALAELVANSRRAIARYHADHKGVYPGQKAAADCDGRTLPVGEPAFAAQLLWYSNADGGVCRKFSTLYPLGPYVRWTGEAVNPVTGSSETVVVFSGDLALAADGPGGGFKYDPETGNFFANDTTLDPDGVPYSSY